MVKTRKAEGLDTYIHKVGTCNSQGVRAATPLLQLKEIPQSAWPAGGSLKNVSCSAEPRSVLA